MIFDVESRRDCIVISIKQAIAMRGENPSLDRKSPESSEMEFGGIWEDKWKWISMNKELSSDVRASPVTRPGQPG